MIEPQEVTPFSLAADAILARPRPRKAPPVQISRQETDDTMSFHVEVESIVGRMVRQIRDQEESQARALLKMAYDAGLDDGADEVSRCCGCSTRPEGDFDAFLARLLKATQEA